MNFPIFAHNFTIIPQGKITGSVFMFTGKGLSTLGLPNCFLFQMPDKFSLPIEESIDQYGLLVNILPLTNGMCLLTEHLGNWIWNRRIDH